jgi:nicotinamide riboside kinase
MLFVLTGPESTAKSTVARALSEHFAVPYVPETAREYLISNRYLPSDLLAIARLQCEAERRIFSSTTSGSPSVPSGFADTDLQVIYLWWQERFGVVPMDLVRAYAGLEKRHYLLCAPDIEWSADALRENPHDRDRLFELYQADLLNRNLPFTTVSGAGGERFDCAVAAVTAALT